MSTFLCGDDHHIRPFLEHWAPGLRDHMRVVSYREASTRALPDDDCFVFSDLERSTWHRSVPKWSTYGRVRALRSNARVLNHPSRVRGRYELLRLLHERGLNDFNVYRLSELHEADAAGKVRYPVFLRRDRDHAGPRSPLLHSADEVRRAVDALPVKLKLAFRAQLVVTEYCPCPSPDGITRKYGVQRIGNTYLPRHVMFGPTWVVKSPNIVTAETVAEEQAFVDACPHLEQVREVFELARIEYGRVDYGVRDGRIQVWEINTAPSLFPKPRAVKPARLALQWQCANAIAEAFRALDR